MTTYKHLYKTCRLCPRLCEVDRILGEKGFCGQGPEMRAAFAGIHRGEEPPISVQSGSGTIFFTGCTLHCSYCQNRQISQNNIGRTISKGDFSKICLILEKKGAANINLVTGTQFIPSIREGIDEARANGLTIPIVWNTSSFESIEGLQVILPVVDIFLADIKTLSREHSQEFCNSGIYPEIAVNALDIMVSKRTIRFGDKNNLLSGTIVRHLVLPGELDSTERVIHWLGTNSRFRNKILLSILVQFVDTNGIPSEGGVKVSGKEYEKILSMLDIYGIKDGYIQEISDTDYTDWVPDFTHVNPFPSSFADPVWHYREGFIH